MSLVIMEIQIIYSLIFLLVILQTIVGVGVLVVGTPIMLILNFNIIETMNVLLPISIITSFLNYFYLKSQKEKFKINLDQEIKKNFIIILFPGIFIGLFLTYYYFDYINFKILVSFVIFFSLFVKWKFNNLINTFPVKIKKIILLFISIIHGLTNSGGTLLTIFFTSLNKNKVNQSRYSVTFYYLIFASIQYFVFVILFKDDLSYNNILNYMLIVILSSIIGNLIIKYISEIFFKNLISFLALFSGIILLLVNK